MWRRLKITFGLAAVFVSAFGINLHADAFGDPDSPVVVAAR